MVKTRFTFIFELFVGVTRFHSVIQMIETHSSFIVDPWYKQIRDSFFVE